MEQVFLTQEELTKIQGLQAEFTKSKALISEKFLNDRHRCIWLQDHRLCRCLPNTCAMWFFLLSTDKFSLLGYLSRCDTI